MDVSDWEWLPEVLARVMEARGLTKDEAQADICRAINNGALNFQCKLRERIYETSTSTAELERNALEIMAPLRPEDFDWESSRPLKKWIVRRESGFRPSGPWDLEWIKLLRENVTKFLCSTGQRESPEQAWRRTGTRRTSPALERAQEAIRELFPQDLPNQADLPNRNLCLRVHKKIEEKGLPNVSDDTVLRAAGRRK
jgi:hypothetical protein